MGFRVNTWAAFAVCALTMVALVAGCAADASDPQTETTKPTQVPTTPPLSPEELRLQRANEWVEVASTRELVGSVLMSSFPSVDGAAIREVMLQTGLGGFIIMSENVPPTPDDLAALTSDLSPDRDMPPLVAIDEEGGLVTRIPWDTYAGADELREMPASATSQAFSGRAELLASAGINVNFGVVADVSDDPSSFIYLRTLGNDPASAAERVAAAVTAEGGDRDYLVASTLKHFPGHGAAPGDSHSVIPTSTMSREEWRQSEALPFVAGIDAGAALLMFGHLSYTSVTSTPASLAPEWYSVARNDLGFTGVMVTDDLGMLQDSGLPEYQNPVTNTVAALQAGADLALIVRGMDAPGIMALVDGVTAAVEDGALSRERLREAAINTLELRLRLAERAKPR